MVVESRGCDKITIFAVAANVVILYGSRDVGVNSGPIVAVFTVATKICRLGYSRYAEIYGCLIITVFTILYGVSRYEAAPPARDMVNTTADNTCLKKFFFMIGSLLLYKNH